MDPHTRARTASTIINRLSAAAPGCVAELRGSLASDKYDAFSDIDIRWEIPDAYFHDCIEKVVQTLQPIGLIESVRSDVDLQNSAQHRILFVQFAKFPLFWRVDIEVFATSIDGDVHYDIGNPAAKGDDWFPSHSALMNAVGAIKSLLRGNEQQARDLLKRAVHRIGLIPTSQQPAEQIMELAARAATMDVNCAALAERVKTLCIDTLANRKI